VERKHLRAEEVLSTREAGRQLELMGHVVRLHDLVGPLAIDLVKLINLEPASADASSLGRVVDGSVQEVSDGARVTGGVPLNLDGVALSGRNGLNARGHLAAADVAGHVIRCYVCDGAVGGRHPDTDLVTGGLIVDPELVKVLVSRDGAEESGSDDSLGEHFESCFGW
jgi:hypothetical protein